MKWETFVKEFNETFGLNGFAHATVCDGHLFITIGDRDAEFDLKTGECTGSGMWLASKWRIVKED